MKRTITFLGTVVAAFFVMNAANAQYLPLKGFEDQSVTSGGWTTQVEVGADDWSTNNQGSGHSGTYYGTITNYNGSGNDPSEAWLISPSVDLSGATMPVLTFISAYKFAGPTLEVKVSTDYTGSGSPAAATWTDLSPTLSSGSFSWAPSGNVDLSSYNGQTIYVAFRYTGSASDGSTWELDDIKIDEPATASTKSIYEIQYTTAPSGDSPEMGNLVSTGGIVMGVRSSGSAGYWIQDNSGPWHGVFVYDNTNAPAVGDSITLDATVDEFNGATQLENIANFQIVSNGNTLYTPSTVTIAQSQSEDYEGTYVRTENVTCTNASAAFGNWEITDASGTTLVGKFIFDYANRNDNDVYNVQGIAYVYDDGTTPEYQILTTNTNDVELVSGASIEENNFEMSLYPNPAQNNVTLVAPTKSQVEVVSVTGALVESFQTTTNKTVVNTTNIPAGVYFVKVTAENTTITQKLIVK